MHNELDNFYLKQTEPNRSCFIALRDIILAYDNHIAPDWKYKLPFFMYKGKMLCYLWKDKKTDCPYISFAKGQQVRHPLLESGNRKRFKIMSINPVQDIDIKSIHEILEQSIQLMSDFSK